jgi:Transposase IS116/IS110/IS902 family
MVSRSRRPMSEPVAVCPSAVGLKSPCQRLSAVPPVSRRRARSHRFHCVLFPNPFPTRQPAAVASTRRLGSHVVTTDRHRPLPAGSRNWCRTPLAAPTARLRPTRAFDWLLGPVAGSREGAGQPCCLNLDVEAAELERHIDAITATAAPQLRAVYGVGPDTAATLLSAIGDNHDRIRSDATFAKLCGVCPLEASSGKTIRHRLSRGGNRDAKWGPARPPGRAHAPPSTHPRLPRAPPGRRQQQKRHHALPQALHRSRNLPCVTPASRPTAEIVA